MEIPEPPKNIKRTLNLLTDIYENAWGIPMEPEKLSPMEKKEYDELIERQFMCRISYMGEEYPQIKPFIYVFDGNHIYVLATKYGKKVEFLEKKPNVTIEIEKYNEDLSTYKFVALSGELTKVKDEEIEKACRQRFVDLIKNKNLSKNILVALGYSKDEPIEAIIEKKKNFLLRLEKVEKIMGYKR